MALADPAPVLVRAPLPCQCPTAYLQKVDVVDGRRRFQVVHDAPAVRNLSLASQPLCTDIRMVRRRALREGVDDRGWVLPVQAVLHLDPALQDINVLTRLRRLL